MRIAFLGPCHPFRGGIAHFAEQLAKEFLSKDIEIRMFNFIHQYPALIFPASGQYATTQEDLPFPQERVLTPYNPLTWKFTCKRIDRFAPNILILSYWLPIFAPVYLWILAHLRHTKVFLLAHNLDFHERWPLADCLSKKLIHKVDKVIVLSAKSAGDLLTLNPESGQSKLIRGFHPIFTDYQNIGRTHEREEFTLLFFGLVKEYKGLDILLKALPMVKNVLPKIKLIIAGDVYGKKDQYQQIISEHNLEEHLEIHFRYIENDEVPGFFERAEVCVLPYRSATQSGIIALAYAFDLPVIATRVGGISEYVTEGENGTGILVPANDPKLLADAIVTYFQTGARERLTGNIGALRSELTWAKLASLILS